MPILMHTSPERCSIGPVAGFVCDPYCPRVDRACVQVQSTLAAYSECYDPGDIAIPSLSLSLSHIIFTPSLRLQSSWKGRNDLRWIRQQARTTTSKRYLPKRMRTSKSANYEDIDTLSYFIPKSFHIYFYDNCASLKFLYWDRVAFSYPAVRVLWSRTIVF